MQVQNNISSYSPTNKNFKRIKSIKTTGLYKKYPEYAEKLVSALKKNCAAMDFFKKYDADIRFHAENAGYNDLRKSSIYVSIDNPHLNKFKKFISSLFGGKQSVHLTAWDDKFKQGASTQKLIQYITPEENGYSMLQSHLELAEEDLKKDLAKKTKALAKKKAAKEANDEFKSKTTRLNSVIYDLIESSKQ